MRALSEEGAKIFARTARAASLLEGVRGREDASMRVKAEAVVASASETRPGTQEDPSKPPNPPSWVRRTEKEESPICLFEPDAPREGEEERRDCCRLG